MILDKGTYGSFKTSLFNKEYQIGCIRYYRTNVPRFLERNLRRAPSVTRCPRYLGGFTGTLGSNRCGGLTYQHM